MIERRRLHQRGVALITVLLVVALASVAAVNMTTSNQLDQRRTGNRLALGAAHQYALGGEQWAMAILARAVRDEDGPRVDSRDEDWARELPPIPIEGGQIVGRLTDLQGRFNLNTLVAGETVDARSLERFERLLQTLELEPQLAQAVTDWIDSNRDTTYPQGAEDDYYATLDVPHLAANRPFTVASELRLVRGIDEGAWRRLAPHVTALPARRTAINVNTATARTLQAIVPGLAADAAEALRERAAEEPFESVADFLAASEVESAQASAGDSEEIDERGLGVSSRFFRSRVDVQLGPIEYTLYSWLERTNDGASRVIRRNRTPN